MQLTIEPQIRRATVQMQSGDPRLNCASSQLTEKSKFLSCLSSDNISKTKGKIAHRFLSKHFHIKTNLVIFYHNIFSLSAGCRFLKLQSTYVNEH